MRRLVLPNGMVVDAGPQGELIDAAVELVHQPRQPAAVVTALHVNGLRASNDSAFIRALEAADIVCADGASVVILARLGGVSGAERAPTTDVGVSIIRAASAQDGLRVALIGGPSGLAAEAGRALEKLTGCTVVYETHGYHVDWREVISDLQRSRADLIVLGLGSPAEAKWAEQFRPALSGTILTCGGWFGFLAGRETRSPRWVQAVGLEWTWRLAQAPRRLGRRYVVGSIATGQLAVKLVLSRLMAR